MTPQDALLNVSARLCERDNWQCPTARPDIKRGVAILWKQMTASERRAFLSNLDDQNRLIAVKPVSPQASEDARIQEILNNWQKVIANVSQANKSFALSIMKNRSKVGWWPSEAQIGRIKQLWREVGE